MINRFIITAVAINNYYIKKTNKNLEYIEFNVQTNNANQDKLFTFTCIAFGNTSKYIQAHFKDLKENFAVYQGSLLPNKKDTSSVIIQVKDVELIGSIGKEKESV